MPRGLRDHFRYPEDIFNAQTEQYTLYHMTDPVQFFKKQAHLGRRAEPRHRRARRRSRRAAAAAATTAGATRRSPPSGNPIDPLYLTMQLPGRARSQEFVLQRSFTPRRKSGILSAFIVRAQSTATTTGSSIVYEVPDTSAPSPCRPRPRSRPTSSSADVLAARPAAVRDVERGDAQLIPIGNTVFYVRPI